MSEETDGNGFDSAVFSRAEDHLKRWPLAQEIYGIATTGPAEWSVRIGVYGEWGTGKTSVLNLVDGMARANGHIVVPFNPWEHLSRDTMWRAFVFGVLKGIEVQLGIPGLSRKAKAKDLGAKTTALIGKVAGSAAGFISDRAGETVEGGIGLLKGFIGFGEKDFKDLRAILNDRRVLVLIDDLDRTSPDLVPEILFALKEVMDLSGFAFVCAFDPAVVGDVLGSYHPGFGNGLKFLEKIIDYPRWLPPPNAAGMRALAHSDIARYCPYVPLAAMDDVVPRLPQNPRVLRQFIRLLALLKPQIDRHYECELGWPVILGANVLKILYPQIAQEFFSDESVWASIAGVRIMGAIEKKEEDKVGTLLSKRLKKAVGRLGIELKADDRVRILGLLRRLADVSDVWLADYRSLAYQIHIAEAPHAVTWKEYDEFADAWAKRRTAKGASAWMTRHAERIGRDEDEVYREVLDATVRSRERFLSRAADAALDSEMKPLLVDAEWRLTLLEQLVFDLGRDAKGGMRIDEEMLKQIVAALLHYLAWTGKKEYREIRSREKGFLRRLVTDWGGDVTPLMNVLQPFSDVPDMLAEKPVVSFRKELRALVLPQFARQVLAGLGEKGFVERVMGRGEGTYAIGCLIFDVGGPLWKGLRADVLALLGRADKEPTIQLSAIKLLHWFDYKMRREATFSETESVVALLSSKRICRALWGAATIQPLNPRHVGQLQEFPGRIKGLGVTLPLPRWWRRALKELGIAEKKPMAISSAAIPHPPAIQGTAPNEPSEAAGGGRRNTREL